MKNTFTTKADLAAASKIYPTWNAPLFELPLRFTYGGKEYRGMPENTRISSEWTDANIFRAEYTSVIDDVLEVKLVYREYRDYPVREWIAYFTNVGSTDTKILENAVIGGTLPGKIKDFVWNTGDGVGTEGYTFFTESFEDKNEFSMYPLHGLPCHGASPYMTLHTDSYSMRIGISWSAMWGVSIKKFDDGSAEYTVGQKRCHMVIRPTETMRTPQLTTLVYDSDEAHGINLWRRWYMEHIMPKENGKPLGPKLCMLNWMCDGACEHTAATEENQLNAIQTYLNNGIKPDVWWIDAGWYPCSTENWRYLGTWKPDPERFPNGLSPIGKKCEENSMRFLLWFEPEFVLEGSQIYNEHRDWLLGNYLLNLADPEARQWLTDHVDKLIKESGIGIYRQDFNDAPYQIWVNNEAEDRIGAIENLHVQGYLRYWDELLMNNPGLLIDSCASGGRRNDLDTMRRAVPLHYTDVTYGIPEIVQCQIRFMFEWIPYFRLQNQFWYKPDCTVEWNPFYVSEYSYLCNIGPAMTDMTRYDSDDKAFELAHKMQAVWRDCADLMLRGDYYPLTECRKDPSDWYAAQFDDAEAGEGFVQVIANIKADGGARLIPMHVIEGMNYTFTNMLTGEGFTKTSAELENGISVTLETRNAVIFRYTYE